MQATHDFVAIVVQYGPTRDEVVAFFQGTQFVWNPAQHNFAGFVDLRIHAVVGEVADRDQDIRGPLDGRSYSVTPSTKKYTILGVA